jgi:t-SNARE complex subunit (syntaxin)
MDDGDLNMQIKIEKERNLLLRELEEKNNNINRIMNEMGNMVGGEQKDLIYDINDNMVDALNNVEKANE